MCSAVKYLARSGRANHASQPRIVRRIEEVDDLHIKYEERQQRITLAVQRALLPRRLRPMRDFIVTRAYPASVSEVSNEKGFYATD